MHTRALAQCPEQLVRQWSVSAQQGCAPEQSTAPNQCLLRRHRIQQILIAPFRSRLTWVSYEPRSSARIVRISRSNQNRHTQHSACSATSSVCAWRVGGLVCCVLCAVHAACEKLLRCSVWLGPARGRRTAAALEGRAAVVATTMVDHVYSTVTSMLSSAALSVESYIE